MTTDRAALARLFVSRRAGLAAAAFVLAGLVGPGCAVEPGAGEPEEVAWDQSGLSVEAASLTSAALELDGVAAGSVTEVVIEEDGQAHVTFVADDAAPLLAYALHELADEPTLADLRVQGTDATSKAVREVQMTECLMKEVSFRSLDAKDGKSHMTVTLTFVAEDVKYANGTGAPIAATASKPIQWGLGVPGLPTEALNGLSLTARRPTKVHAAWETAGLTIAGSALLGADKTAEDLVAASALVDVTLTLTDESTGATTSVSTAGTASKFTTAPEAKGGESGGTATWTLDLLCAEQRISATPKA